MDEGKLKQVAPWAIGGIVVLLLLRARSSGGQAVAADKNDVQQAAEKLQLQQQAQQVAYSSSMLQLRQQIAQAQAQNFLDFSGFTHRLATNTRTEGDAAFMCAAGKARIDPQTGQVYCRTKQGGGLTLGSFLYNAAQAYGTSQGGF
jgi:hypothetical protein